MLKIEICSDCFGLRKYRQQNQRLYNTDSVISVWSHTKPTRVIQDHFSQQKNNDPEVVELLANTLYVDDFPEGVPNVEKGYHLYQQSKETMKKGGFNLRK